MNGAVADTRVSAVILDMDGTLLNTGSHFFLFILFYLPCLSIVQIRTRELGNHDCVGPKCLAPQHKVQNSTYYRIIWFFGP